MQTSTIATIVAILVIIAGGAWYYTNSAKQQAATDTTTTEQVPAPSGAAGVNGSANQGNLGQPNTGVVQQPGADGAEGSVIESNVALGLNSNKTLGNYLIGYNGMTLYLYTKDTGKDSTCYDQCAVNWPPYIVGPEDNVTNVKEGVDPKKVGTTIRTDGKIQVTYNGHPLYFWKNDKQSGDTTGQGVGEVWYVLKP